MKESRKEFIKKAHSAACSEWKENIEKEFPKLFKEDKTPYGWYFASDSKVFLYYFDGNTITYGFNWEGKFRDNLMVSGKHGTPATDKEVEEALIKEAKKRGYRKNAVIITSKTGVKRTLNSNHFKMIGNNLVCLSSKESYIYSSVFTNGKWAEIVETITKEQAEKELGKTILN